MKVIYKGFRLRDGTCRITRDGKTLDLHLELRNHPETCGEHGRNCVDYERTFSLYQKFKWDVVSKFPHGGWTLNDKFIRAWIRVTEQEPAA